MSARKKAKGRKRAAGEGVGREDRDGPRRGATRSEANGDPGELLSLNEAVERLKTTRATFYRWLRSGRIRGMKVGRQWRFTREDVERFLRGAQPRIEPPPGLAQLIRDLDRLRRRLGSESCPDFGEDEPAQCVARIVAVGAAAHASDIHLAPVLGDDGSGVIARLRYRVDGVLHCMAEIDPRLLPAIAGRWKAIAGCDVRETGRPQIGRTMTRIGDAVQGALLDLVSSFVPTSLGESVTLRILDRDAGLIDLERIDFSPSDRQRLVRAVDAPNGLILVNGPTGSGKTTVLYACLQQRCSDEIKVMTIEDPVEYHIPGAVQIQVDADAGMSFAAAGRAVMRSDPDIVMVGELRSLDALMLAVQVTLTGHLVMSTLHVNEAAGALRRMIDMGCDPFLVSDATRLCTCQRLIRLVCAECSKPEIPRADGLETAHRLCAEGGLSFSDLEHKFRMPVGCPKCAHTGYRGRTLIAETLAMTPEIGRALIEGASVEQLRSIAVRQGMTTMAADGVRRAAQGATTLAEVLRVLPLR